MNYKLLIPLFFLTITACSLEREVDINLPEYQNVLVVESYLEAGEPYRLLLTETFSYFDLPPITPLDLDRPIVLDLGFTETTSTLQNLIDDGWIQEDQIPALPPSIDDAVVVITHNGVPDTLINQLYVQIDERLFFDTLQTNVLVRFYNFISDKVVPLDYDNDFFLNVVDGQGRTAVSQTRFIPPIPIDSSFLKYNQDSLAAYQMWFTDPPNEDNYYRRVLNKRSIFRSPVSDFAINDRFYDGAVLFSTGFNYDRDDERLISTLYHIDEAYHDFLETFEEAEGANGNPFGQPAVIKSNIEGGNGIFTFLSYDREVISLE